MGRSLTLNEGVAATRPLNRPEPIVCIIPIGLGQVLVIKKRVLADSQRDALRLALKT